jgi:chromosome partition protein MukE
MSEVVSMSHMLEDRRFPEVDQLLRRGGHIGQEDQDRHEFLTVAQRPLYDFYKLYGAELSKTPENVYYLEPTEGALFRTHVLRKLDMVVGKTLANIMLEPDWVETGRILFDRILTELDLSPGRATLVQLAAIKSHNEDVWDKKLREDIRRSLNVLDGLNFIQWDNRSDEILPFRALMRFADDVRSIGSAQDNLASKIAAGTVVVDAQVENDELDDDQGDEE